MSPKSPHPDDVAVGRRIATRRKQLGVSQEVLATHLGITFQQVQKYEKGTNRVSASRLLGIARRLETSVAVLVGEGEAGEVLSELAHLSDDGRTAALLVDRIGDPAIRRRAIDLLSLVAATAGDLTRLSVAATEATAALRRAAA